MVQILPHPKADLGTIYTRVHSPIAHVFTIAGLRSLSEGLDRPVTPFVKGESGLRALIDQSLMSVRLWRSTASFCDVRS